MLRDPDTGEYFVQGRWLPDFEAAMAELEERDDHLCHRADLEREERLIQEDDNDE